MKFGDCPMDGDLVTLRVAGDPGEDPSGPDPCIYRWVAVIRNDETVLVSSNNLTPEEIAEHAAYFADYMTALPNEVFTKISWSKDTTLGTRVDALRTRYRG